MDDVTFLQLTLVFLLFLDAAICVCIWKTLREIKRLENQQ